MIELYQELVPFTNEKSSHEASKDGAYTNPIVAPLSFDVTSAFNTVETVLYIRNTDKDKYYNNVHICLLAPTEAANDIYEVQPFSLNSVILSTTNGVTTTLFKNANPLTKFILDTEYCSEVDPVPSITLLMSTIDTSMCNSLFPLSGISTPDYTISQVNSEVIDVRFSFGYDEVSENNWQTKKRSLVIPAIGNQYTPDNSFIPVRMRLYLNQNYGDMLTLRKYSIHLAYGYEGALV
jgi:hypothetical protein